MFFECWTFYQRFAAYTQDFLSGQSLFGQVAQAPPQYLIQVKAEGLQIAIRKFETKD